MFAAAQSFLSGSKTEAEPRISTSVTFTGVRIPADGKPPHLLSFTTTDDQDATDSFLVRIPDLRKYWAPESAWKLRDIDRFDLLSNETGEQISQLRRIIHQQNRIINRLLLKGVPEDPQQALYARQRNRLLPQPHVLKADQLHCTGLYYAMYSFALDDLPKNLHVPPWLTESCDSSFCGDAFIIKMAGPETDENGWAVYEDIAPEFLHVLREGPALKSPRQNSWG